MLLEMEKLWFREFQQLAYGNIARKRSIWNLNPRTLNSKACLEVILE